MTSRFGFAWAHLTAQHAYEKAWTLPRILVPGVVKNLKATHTPPLD
jgi:hypothetical protein